MNLTNEADKLAILWNKTKDEKYKVLWYKKIKEFADGRNIDNTNTTVRWNVSKREVRFGKTNEST